MKRFVLRSNIDSTLEENKVFTEINEPNIVDRIVNFGDGITNLYLQDSITHENIKVVGSGKTISSYFKESYEHDTERYVLKEYINSDLDEGTNLLVTGKK